MGKQDTEGDLRNVSRRRFVAALSVATGSALAGCSDGSVEGQSEPDDPPEPGDRITGARRVGPRDVSDFGYKDLWGYRKRQAVETLLADPAVNDVASDWVASFEAYDPLTNDLDAISVQGTTGMSVDGGRESGEFEVTAEQRQVAYGLVDRHTEELLALHITDPIDVTWNRDYPDEEGRRRHEYVLDHDEVWQHLEGNDWYPMEKAAEIITAYGDYAHGEVSPSIYYVMQDGELNVVSTFINVAGDDIELLDVVLVEDFAEHPPQQLAREMNPDGETVLGSVPEPPTMQRPQITAPEGYHRTENVDEVIEDAGWSVEWSGPRTVGAEVSATYNGKPAFEYIAPVSTSTGYALPERNGRNTREFMFPDNEPVFSGELLYWDIHSNDFGGPGVLGTTEYPETPEHPRGFRLRTHFHTGAVPNARDFHSGHRFAPYNYYINYDFYEDGVFMPVWQRQGPGYVTEFQTYRDEEYGGPTIFYVSKWVTRPTPGTTDGIETQVFDGSEWTTPETEFYLEGDDETLVRFRNPDGPESITLALDDLKEVVVVRPKEGEIGESIRALDPEAEFEFYHPAQYVDDEPIQGEEVFAWLLMEGRPDEVPHPSGITTYTRLGEFTLRGY